MRKGSTAWTKAEDDKLLALNASLNRRQLAVEIGRSVDAVTSRLSDLRRQGVTIPDRRGIPLPDPTYQTQKSGRKTRKCLCCERDFMSSGSMNRLCYDCAHTKGAGTFTRSASFAR